MLKKRMICSALLLSLCLAGCGQSSSANNEGLVAYDDVKGNTVAGAAANDYDTKGNTNAMIDEDILTEAFVDDFDYDDNGAVGEVIETPDNQTLKELPAAGQLTAGMWSDNENWGFFSNLINSDRLSYPLFGLDPTKRIAVNVKNKDGNAVPHAAVDLVNEKDEVIWKGVTDHLGRVYLMNKTDDKNVSVKVANDTNKHSVTVSQSANGEKNDKETTSVYSTEMDIVVNSEDKNYKKADIMFIIDSTGSMCDEMTFLQSEFTEITNRIGNEDTRYSVNFYRDEGDDYLTKCSEFSSDVKKVQETLNKESAAGGKGQIAAVAQALDETMNAGDWSDDSVKLAFLIFDAPPYKEAADSLAKSVETAAEKGIRLIPVVGSGSDSDVEQFGRAIAIETGGVYVFLTDDSGIGESHEEPIIGAHEVRPLVDIITDIIKEYRQ